MVTTTVKNDSATPLGIHDIQSVYRVIPPFGGTATVDLDPDDTETASIWGALAQGGGVPANAILLRDNSPIMLRDNTPLLGRAA